MSTDQEIDMSAAVECSKGMPEVAALAARSRRAWHKVSILAIINMLLVGVLWNALPRSVEVTRCGLLTDGVVVLVDATSPFLSSK